ncbi:GntR family transcriptional regulator [Alkalibacter mobilis]|uniref:GntR family transcriptional regulator n=1 Tax=Alkalibacter mobilis TaxID=2787712 RepID=UPI00189DC7CA|nr:GntR family transcriptional regulator [Alkalibacter mobilis]MBF7095670.1 GntR family transcriptional regulator [Alkalibacter mobilis]
MTKVLYLSVVEDIKKKIIAAQLKPGDMLKSESELMKEYNVSRMTLRKSLSLLSNEGYIYSIPGKGNFVCQPDTDVFQFRFDDYSSFIPQVEDIELLSVTVENPEPASSTYEIFKDRQLIRIDRLILSEQIPVALEIVYTPYIPNKPVVEDKLHFANYSKAIETKYAFALKKTLKITFNNSDEYVSKKLNIDEFSEVAKLEKMIVNKETSVPLTFSILYLKKEYFSLTATTPEDDSSKKIF